MNQKKNRTYRYAALVVALLAVLLPASAETARQVLDKAASQLSGGGVSCNFTLSGQGENISGSLTAYGSKFRLKTSGGSTWYDGLQMWTSNPRTHEITLVRPTQSELLDVNPMLWINSYASGNKIGFSRRKDTSRHLILLNPTNRSGSIKAVEIAVNKKTGLPERFIIRDRQDHVVTVTLSSLKTGLKPAASEFICPVSSMAGYELVDLR